MKGLFLFSSGPARRSLADGGAVLPGTLGLRRGLRRPRGTPAHLGRARRACTGGPSSPGATTSERAGPGPRRRSCGSPKRRRPRSRTSGRSRRAGPTRARHALLRRRAVGPLRVEGRGRDVEPEHRPLEPPAPREVDAGRRRPLPAHGPRGPGAARAASRRELDRRRLPDDDGGGTLEGPQPAASARSFSRTSIPSSASASTRSSITPRQPGRLYLQNHWGLYRSDDGGDSWTRHRPRRALGLRFLHGHPSATTPTPSSSCRSTRTGSAARRKASSASTGRGTAAGHGRR